MYEFWGSTHIQSIEFDNRTPQTVVGLHMRIAVSVVQGGTGDILPAPTVEMTSVIPVLAVTPFLSCQSLDTKKSNVSW